MHHASAAFILLLALAGCAAPEGGDPEPAASVPPKETASSEAGTTRAFDLSASCPEGVPYVIPKDVELSVAPVAWSEAPAKASAALAPLVPRGLFDITSNDSRIGGLSGLDFLDDDTLIAVSDQGDLVWIDLAEDGVTPKPAAYIAMLRDSEGNPLSGKGQADSEGVAWDGEHLFVSFERDHRVEGYDIEGCGAMARGVPVARLGDAQGWKVLRVKSNRGPEGLAVVENGNMLVGLETRDADGAGLAMIMPGRTASFDLRLNAPEITLLTGLAALASVDGESVQVFSLHRSYDPIRGNRIALQVSEWNNSSFFDTRRLALWGREIAVDNFEGLAARRLADGTVRLILVSDDNFSDRQRTLLAVLDLPPNSSGTPVRAR